MIAAMLEEQSSALSAKTAAMSSSQRNITKHERTHWAWPSFIKKPKSTVALEGSQVTFLCNAAGSPMPTILWYKDGLELPGSTSRYQILNDNSTLTIKKADRTDEGRYSCNVSNSIGPGLSSSANLTVNYLPKILVSPNDATTVEKANVTLICYLEGKPRATVSWFKDGTPIPTNDARIYLSPPTSVSNTSTTITITIVNRTDEGNYSCRAVNDAGNDTSSAAFLTVNYKPKVLQSPESLTRNENKSVILSCKFEGKPLPSVTWRKNGREIQTSSNSRISTSVSRSNQDNYSGRLAKLEISRLTREDQGHFSCYIQSKIGADLSEVGTLEITYLPFILSSPHDITKKESDQMQLSCSMEGNPKPTVSWHKNGRIISPDWRTTFQIKGNASRWESTVTIKSIKSTDSGSYGCVATNAATVEKVRSKTGRLVVNVKPEIQHKPTDATVIQGEQASFYCNATGVPEPVISWRYSGSSTPKHIGNQLMIDNVRNTEEYEGKYTCIASSRAGRTEESATLTVLVPPTKAADLPQGVILQLGQTLRLKCNVYADPEPSFTWIKRLPRQPEGVMLHDQKKSELVIRDVRVKDAAHYGCSAANRLGIVTLDAVLVDVDTSLEIINGGENFTAVAENNVTIRCVASSEITPEVKMLRNGRVLQTKADVSKDTKVVSTELVIGSVITDDSGLYTCVATNRQKSVKGDVRLVVDVPIKIDMEVTLQDQTFTEELENKSSEKYRNLSATFVQELSKIYINETGFVRVEVLGFRNGSVAVRFRVIYRVRVEKPEDKPPPDTKVRIANVVVRKVKASQGVVGILKINPASIKPLVRPPSPRNLTATNIKKRQMSIAWKHPLFYDNYDVTRYVIKYKVFGSFWQVKELDGKHVDFHNLEELEPGTKYSIQAHAVNHLGEGLPSNLVETETLSAFWETFAKVFIPLLIIAIIIVIVLLICFRRRRQRNTKRQEAMDEQRHKEFLIKKKHVNEEEGILETIELPRRWKELSRDNLLLDKELGSGQFGVVYKGSLTEKGKDEMVPCAVKMLKPNASQEATRDLFNELEIMASVDEHPNIVNILGACTGKDGPMYVIMEFAENGCLLNYLRAHRMSFPSANGTLEEVSSLRNQEKMRLGFDVASGMQHLFKFKCVHRDLAARNVLLGKNRIAKVADFGLARDVYEQGFYEKSSTGGKLPAKWMSIEALETLKATSESDVWSFGVLLWEIETGGRMPFAGLSFTEILKSLKSGTRLPQPANCNNEVYSLMRTCWEADPRKRPIFGDLVWKLDNLHIHYLED